MSSGDSDEVQFARQDDDDDLSRQRRKRAARLVEATSGFEDSRVQAVVADALAAIEQRDGSFDVERYLVDHGHTSETITMVLTRLGLTDLRHPSGRPSPSSRRPVK